MSRNLSKVPKPSMWLRARRLINKRLVQVQNNWLRNAWVLGQPFQLTLEPGNVCNLKCPLCPTTHRDDSIPKGLLSYDKAVQVLNQFPLVTHLVLSNWGEPLLNNDLFEIVAYAKARGVEVRLESNLTLMKPEQCAQLVSSGLDTLVAALDGASQESYEAYRVGGDFDQVLANLSLIRAEQERQDDHGTELIWKMVINRHNEHEVERARDQAQALGMKFEAVTIWVPEDDEQRKEWLPTEPEGLGQSGLRNREGQPARCHNLWQTLSVNFNGDLFPCCSQFSPQDRLSNLLDADSGGSDWTEIWNSAEMRARRRINRGPVDCSQCHKDRNTGWYKTWMEPKTKQS